MELTPKQDLRFSKNEILIRETFRKMLCEMDYSKISVKELAQRAKINRKTFYLHYSSLEHLLASLQFEIMEPASRLIAETEFPKDVKLIIQKSFEIMAALDDTDKKILALKDDFPEKESPADLIRKQLLKKYARLAQFGPFESRILITCFSACLGVIYHQWDSDGRQIPIEELVPLTTRLVLQGLEGSGLLQAGEIPATS